jgi:hypothetical protein
MRWIHLLVSMTLCGAAAAQDYRPDFDPSRLKGPVAGPLSEVLVLGSPHLSQLPKDLQPAAVHPAAIQSVIDRLARWQPHAIAIESLSGVQCEFMRQNPRRYRDSMDPYCHDTTAARTATGLDVMQATTEAETMLASWPQAPSAAQRRRLAAVLLAGGERGSALVQWLRLPAAERRTGDGLDAALVQQLQALETRPDERMMIGARLAARLGHERLFPMDDHTADSAMDDRKAFGDALAKAWGNPATRQRFDADKVSYARLDSPDGLLQLYREDNAPGQGELIFRSDFGAAMNEPSPQRFGRQYLRYWETRNLRMAANIRDAMGTRPGERMLVIVGASHKGYLEAYLHQMHDVRVVDAAPLLR